MVNVPHDRVSFRYSWSLQNAFHNCRWAGSRQRFVVEVCLAYLHFLRSTSSLPQTARMSSLPKSQEESVPDITDSRLDHASIVDVVVQSTDPYLDLLFFASFSSRSLHARQTPEHGNQQDFSDTPFEQRLDSCYRCTTSSNDGVYQDGKLWH